MESSKLLPKEILPLTAEQHSTYYSRPTHIIYLGIIFALIGVFLLLPFLYVDISVTSSGLLRPAVEISAIKIPVSGKVSHVFVSDNQKIQKGQKILSLDSTFQQQRITFLSDEIAEDKLNKRDLHILLSGDDHIASLMTPYYKQDLLSYSQKKKDLTIRYNKARADYNRNLKLYEQKVISDVEFENYKFEYDKMNNELILLRQNQLSKWQSELSNYEKEIAEHESQLTQLIKEKDNLVIKAPINGTIQNLISIHHESQVFANQDIAQISPDTSLVVEVYVSPDDIGLLRKNMPVRFQLDAFNYNQWGLASGEILAVANDIHIINEKPVFKVKCILEKDYLELKNGYRGYLKKGMTLRAWFTVTERTLWQLLYDKMDDWLNPNVYNDVNTLSQ